MLKKLLTWTLALALVCSCTSAFAARNEYNNLEPDGETDVTLGVVDYYQWFVPDEVELSLCLANQSNFFGTVGVQNVLLTDDGEHDKAITIYCDEYTDLEYKVGDTVKSRITTDDWQLRKAAYRYKDEYDSYNMLKTPIDNSLIQEQRVTIPATTKTAILTVRTIFEEGTSSECLFRVDESVTALSNEGNTSEIKSLYNEDIQQPVRALTDVQQASDTVVDGNNNIHLTKVANSVQDGSTSPSFKVTAKLYYSIWGKPAETAQYEGKVTYSVKLQEIARLDAKD